MGRRREPPLPCLLHVLPLVEQVHGERTTVAGGALQRPPAGDDETHARHALETFPRRRNESVEADGPSVDGYGSVGAHRIDDQAAAVIRDDRRAVHLSDMGDRGIRGQRGVDPRRVSRLVLGVRQHDRFAAQIA